MANSNPDLLASLSNQHAVTSPLGLWLVQALVAPAAGGENRTALETVLGAEAEDVAARAACRGAWIADPFG